MSPTEKPRMLWHSNAPWSPTGYGGQTALFAPKIREHYELGISAFYGLEGNIRQWEGIPVFPGIGQTHGNEAILDHVGAAFTDKRRGLVVTLMDVWVLNPQIWSQLNVVSWVPVDHEPCPDPVYNFFPESGAIPMAMSKFGRDQLADLDPLYCPHAVDTNVYRPIDKGEARETINVDTDCFLVGMVAANKGNPSRKCFQEAFEAFKLLHDRHPDARLYLHTEMAGRFDGVNLRALLDAVGVPLSAVWACDQYRAVHLPFPDEHMANVYSAMDVYLSPSAGEGFGIGAIQAQACGTPVIVSDFSAQPELCKAGWMVSGTRKYTPIGSWQFCPDVVDIHRALEAAYSLSDESRDEYASRGREAMAKYDADHVFETYMLPAFEEARERFGDREPVALEATA